MKSLINKIVVGGAIALSTVACTGKFEEFNTNPDEAYDLSPDGYLLVSALSNVASVVIPAQENQIQYVECLQGGTLGGYFTDGNPGFAGNSIMRGMNNNGWQKQLLTDTPGIPTLYSNIAIIKGYCERENLHVPVAICDIIKVAYMSRTTDCYGPIPYSKITTDGDIVTPYDSQKDVYHKFFEDLDEAIATLKEYPGEALIPSADAVYRGNLQNWIKYANSLKLRLAMRISYAEPALAKQVAEAAVADGVIENNSESAAWNYFTGSTNPYYIAVNYNSAQGTGDSRPAADIVCYMNGYNDPRRAEYFYYTSNATPYAGVDYIGLRRGWRTVSNDWSVNFSSIKMSPNDPLVWMNAAEVAFLRAEGAAVFGWNMGGTAKDFYETGVKLSFEQYGVSGAEEYLADNVSMPEAYNDPTGLNPWSGSLPKVTIAWDESATTEQKQERIIVQKWIANYKNGHEAWAELRRTGYPKLIPVAYNNSAGVWSSDRGPERLCYPASEYVNNAANMKVAVSMLGGPDNMGTKLWWACKPGL